MIPASRDPGDVRAEDAQLRAIARQGREDGAPAPESVSDLDPEARAEIHAIWRGDALYRAVAAADRHPPRTRPLTRARALRAASAIWRTAQAGPLSRYAEAGVVSRREWCAAYADRLIERGLALPSTAELPHPSGSSGRHASPRIKVSCSDEQLIAWRRKAGHAGLDLSEWVRRALDGAA